MKHNIEYPVPFMGPLCFYYEIDRPVVITEFIGTVNKNPIQVNNTLIPGKRGKISQLSLEPIITGGFLIFIHIETRFPDWDLRMYDPENKRDFSMNVYYPADWTNLQLPPCRELIQETVK